mmetsp:Transcript_52195/g.52576  ORF Transcript_52195/g.52576 Transcript_52195/m.52576 type:complete len:84 (-) Transcript_52195:828-1079(-)
MFRDDGGITQHKKYAFLVVTQKTDKQSMSERIFTLRAIDSLSGRILSIHHHAIFLQFDARWAPKSERFLGTVGIGNNQGGCVR